MERAMQLIWKQRARRPSVCWSGAWCNQGNKANRADTDRFRIRAVTSAGELLIDRGDAALGFAGAVPEAYKSALVCDRIALRAAWRLMPRQSSHVSQMCACQSIYGGRR